MRKKKYLAVLMLLCLAFIGWMTWGNCTVGCTRYALAFDELPAVFDGFTIAQVSDFHNSRLGDAVIRHLEKAQPDMIAITGDLVDANHTDIDVALNLAAQLTQIAPCYYISGNHEAWLSEADYARLENSLCDMGVTVLNDRAVPVEKDGEAIAVTGIADSGFGHSLSAQEIDELSPEGAFTVLLAHRPEKFDDYVCSGADLTLSGHVHGGQFRLPFVGGVIGPYYIFFPEYDAGVFAEGGQRMIVSRGIGNSVVPVRFGNRPEVVLIELNR